MPPGSSISSVTDRDLDERETASMDGKKVGRRSRAAPLRLRLGLDSFRPGDELALLEDDVAVEVVGLPRVAILRIVLGQGAKGVEGACRIRAVLNRMVPAVIARSDLDVDRLYRSIDCRIEIPLGCLDRIEVVVEGVLLDGSPDAADVGHGPLLLAPVDGVEQVRDGDGSDDADDGHDDE